MIPRPPHKHIRHRTNSTPPIRIILPRTPIPHSPLIDMDFPGSVRETEESAREDGDGVLAVCDALDCTGSAKERVDVGCEGGVADLEGGRGSVGRGKEGGGGRNVPWESRTLCTAHSRCSEAATSDEAR